MPHPDNDTVALDCTIDTVVENLLPYYITAAKGDRKTAERTIVAQVTNYRANTPAEIDLVARILGFTAAAADDLRRAMAPGLSDNSVLRFRANALACEKAAEACRKLLGQIQEFRRQRRQLEAERARAEQEAERARVEQARLAQAKQAPETASMPDAASTHRANSAASALSNPGNVASCSVNATASGRRGSATPPGACVPVNGATPPPADALETALRVALGQIPFASKHANG